MQNDNCAANASLLSTAFNSLYASPLSIYLSLAPLSSLLPSRGRRGKSTCWIILHYILNPHTGFTYANTHTYTHTACICVHTWKTHYRSSITYLKHIFIEICNILHLCLFSWLQWTLCCLLLRSWKRSAGLYGLWCGKGHLESNCAAHTYVCVHMRVCGGCRAKGERYCENEIWWQRDGDGAVGRETDGRTGDWEVCGELSEVLLISERLRGPVTCHWFV